MQKSGMMWWLWSRKFLRYGTAQYQKPRPPLSCCCSFPSVLPHLHGWGGLTTFHSYSYLHTHAGLGEKDSPFLPIKSMTKSYTHYFQSHPISQNSITGPRWLQGKLEMFLFWVALWLAKYQGLYEFGGKGEQMLGGRWPSEWHIYSSFLFFWPSKTVLFIILFWGPNEVSSTSKHTINLHRINK